MKLRAINHIGITVSDFEKSVKWYWDTFKMVLLSDETISARELKTQKHIYGLEDVALRYGLLRCPRGSSIEIFHFSKTKPIDMHWNQCGVSHFSIDVKAIRKGVKQLESLNVEILCNIEKSQGVEWTFIRDPDGNLIELVELGFKYYVLKYLGGFIGLLFKKTKYKQYYR